MRPILYLIVLLCCIADVCAQSSISLQTGFDNNSYYLHSKNDDITRIGFIDKNTFITGLQLNYNEFLVGFDFCPIDFNLCGVNLSYSNDYFFAEVDFEYRKNKIRGMSESVSPSENYDSEADSNKAYPNAVTYGNLTKIGYMFDLEFIGIGRISYQALFFQNKRLKDGILLGLMVSPFYNYSSFKSDTTLPPSSESSFYNESGSLKGDSFHSVGLNTSPGIAFSYSGVFLSLIFPVTPVLYKNGEIYTDANKTVSEVTYFEDEVGGFYLIAGYTTDIYFVSINLGGENYKYYDLPGVKDVSAKENNLDAVLKVGVRF